MGRRANGEGTCYRRPDGLWVGQISYTDAVTGKVKRHTVYGKTAREVRAKLAERRARLAAGAPVRDATVTVSRWVEEWITKALAASPRRASTKQTYAILARCHLQPQPFGALTLERLRPSDIESLVTAKRAAGLSGSTVRAIYTVLRAALEVAVRDGLVARNAAALVARPTVERQEARYLDAEQVARLFDAAREDRLFALYVLMLGTGLRRGEALALGLDDLDLDVGAARVRYTLGRVNGALVRGEPKTEKSRRTVPLPAPVVTALRAHRKQRVADQLRAGSEWQDSGLVFTTAYGAPLDPRNVLRAFTSVAERAGLSGAGLHTLRHSCATALLEAGIPMRVVGELLGHSSFAVTADVYSHVGGAQTREAADRLEHAFAW